MCGLSGAFGNCDWKVESTVKQMLIVNQLRGTDATGIASISRFMQDVTLAKEVGPPEYLFDTKRFNKVFSGTNAVFMGHNRAGTIGENKRKNAHPFELEHIVGCHNGTVSYTSKNRLERGSSFDTDSEAIMFNIQLLGVEETLSRIDNDQAYALVWYDKRDRSMNFIRNDKRPLVYCYVNDRKTVLYGSEYDLMAGIVRRNDNKLVPNEKTGKAFYEFTENIHYKWIVPESINTPLAKPLCKEVLAREPVKYYYQKKTTSNFRTGTGLFTTSTGGHSDENNPHLGDISEDGKMRYEGLYIGWVPVGVPVDKQNQVVITKAEDPKSIIDRAVENLQKKQDPSKSGAMSALDFLRRQAWDRADKAGLIPKDKDGVVPPTYKETRDLKVWKNFDSNSWTYLSYDVVRNNWALYEKMSRVPEDMPYSIVDPNRNTGSHLFRWKGSKGKKTPFYRGFNGRLLGQTEFNQFMKNGCVDCSRSPEWGNEVAFISEHGEFLCEYCAQIPGHLEMMLNCSKTKNVA